eukprot:gene15045-21118_t
MPGVRVGRLASSVRSATFRALGVRRLGFPPDPAGRFLVTQLSDRDPVDIETAVRDPTEIENPGPRSRPRSERSETEIRTHVPEIEKRSETPTEIQTQV